MKFTMNLDRLPEHRKLALAVKALGKTQKEVASDVGVTHGTLRNFFAGQPSNALAQRIEKYVEKNVTQ